MSATRVRYTMLPLAKILGKCYVRAISSQINLSSKVSCGTITRRAFTNCSAHLNHQALTAKVSQHRLKQLATLPASINQSKALHTSCIHRGLEEFFDDPKNYGEPNVKAGRHWEVDEIRLKDNATLHKLWYVLLKEKNMLLTLETEALRLDRYMPGQERLQKVEKSMRNIQDVIKERNEALTELKTGHREAHPGKMVYTPFGYRRYLKPSEHHVPKYLNKDYRRKRYSYAPYVRKFIGKWMEQEQLKRQAEKRQRKNLFKKLKKRFPNADVWQN